MEPYEGTEPYIFMSYARKDWERVKPFLDALSNAGYRLWWDKGISAGADWLDTLLEKVEKCAVFCPLFSEAFTDSRYCLFETAWAYQKTDKTIVSLYLDSLEKDNLGRLYQHLRKFQELRLYDLTPAQFVEGLERETMFAPCRVPEWNKVGQIQWRLSADGVLEIAMNENILEWYNYGSIPAYQREPVHGDSTAPWMPYREKILSLEIRDDIDEIGDFAFFNCRKLTSVRIPDSVTSIGNGAFYGCDSLTAMRIPDGVTKIGDYAFQFCYSLKAAHISANVSSIGKLAFWACKSLTDVRISDSVITIGNRAFRDCPCLESVEIPVGTEVDEEAFPEHTRVIRRDAAQ